MAELILTNLLRRFGPVIAVNGISLTVADGEFVSLLGPSGCGKSTTLAAIAGLDRPDGGRIQLGPHTFYDSASGVFVPPERRNCGLVFQSYALWPHMTVRQNVAFPLDLRKIKGAEAQRRIEEVLSLVEMVSFADRYPHQLSGGQQQRVALARTLVYQPELLLLDEPLSNLDAKLRDRARAWLAELRHRLKLTTIYVTHDQIEALALSDRVVVMNGGNIAQIGTPQEIYEDPADPFVADFIGTMNFLKGEAEADAAAGATARMRLPDGGVVQARAHSALRRGDRLTLALRPEQLRVGSDAAGAGGTPVSAKVVTSAYVGGAYQVAYATAGGTMRLDQPMPPDGEATTLWVPDDGGTLFRETT